MYRNAGFFRAISKVLSANDVGETGGHQSGILIQKLQEVLSFFPDLNNDEKNPRAILNFVDDDGEIWEFHFIYYNNSYFGGTRNEYRLTRMTEYIRKYNLEIGDEIILGKDEVGRYQITYRRMKAIKEQRPNYLKLSNNWKVIKY